MTYYGSQRALFSYPIAIYTSMMASSFLQADPHRTYYCGKCHDQYMEFTDLEEKWIGCSSEACDTWYHFVCIGLNPEEPAPDDFFCDNCAEI